MQGSDIVASEIVSSRPDLERLGRELFCKSSGEMWAKPWEFGVFDAQLSIQSVHTSDGSKLTADDLAGFNYTGRSGAVVRCSEDKAIAIGVAAPKPWRQSRFDATPWCRGVRFDFVDRDRGRKNPYKIGQKIRSDGVVSVTCWPLDRNKGPELWYLMPVGKGPYRGVLNVEALERGLFTWINSVRQREGQAPLKVGVLTPKQIKSLAATGLVHQREILLSLKQEFEQKGFSFVGEDRVIGRSLPEKAWLLWNSPRHRDLLLHPEATHAVLIDDGELTVVIVSKKA